MGPVSSFHRELGKGEQAAVASRRLCSQGTESLGGAWAPWPAAWCPEATKMRAERARSHRVVFPRLKGLCHPSNLLSPPSGPSARSSQERSRGRREEKVEPHPQQAGEAEDGPQTTVDRQLQRETRWVN